MVEVSVYTFLLYLLTIPYSKIKNLISHTERKLKLAPESSAGSNNDLKLLQPSFCIMAYAGRLSKYTSLDCI